MQIYGEGGSLWYVITLISLVTICIVITGMFLICCVISTKFGGCRHYVIGDIMVFVHHVTLQDHVTKALNNFMVRSL